MKHAKRMGPVASVIQEYKEGARVRTKAVSEKTWRRNLRNLAEKLARARDVVDDVTASGRHYVYVILDPRCPGSWSYITLAGRAVKFPYKPIYVGKGTGKRSFTHSLDRNLSSADHKTRTILQIREAGLHEIIKHSKDVLCSDWMAQAYEIDLIASIGRRSKQAGPLTNLTDGGEGASGAKMPKSLAHRTKLSQANLGRTQSASTRAKLSAIGKGRPHSEEHKQRLSAALKGREFSEEHRKKISQALTGRKQSAETIAKRITQQLGSKKSAETRARMSEAQLNRTPLPKVKCPVCKTVGDSAGMKRWHFENCKGVRPYHAIKKQREAKK